MVSQTRPKNLLAHRAVYPGFIRQIRFQFDGDERSRSGGQGGQAHHARAPKKTILAVAQMQRPIPHK